MALTVHRAVVGLLETNCYVLMRDGRDDCLVIDPGASASKILALTEGRKIAAILLTHGHFDHCGAAEDLMGEGTRLLIHEADAAMPGDPAWNVSWMIGRAFALKAPLETFRDGDVLDLAGIRLKVIHTPGHTRGSCCFETEDLLFTGDTVMGGSVGRTDLPGGDEAQLWASVARIRPLFATHRILGGHGE